MVQEHLVVLGLNHKKAPVEVREKLAFRREDLGAQVRRLLQESGAAEGVILSTCNRVEVYVASSDPEVSGRVTSFLASAGNSVPEAMRDYLYRHTDEETVVHLFEVAAGLDSMVVGETQVIAQVKEAYETARQEGCTARSLNPLFQKALGVAKLVHTTTRLSEGNMSVPSVAARLAGKIFDDLSRRSILVIGAGEVGELTLQAFCHAGLSEVRVCNRTVEKAQDLVRRYGGEALSMSELPRALPLSDIVVTCLNADEFVVTPDQLSTALVQRKNRPMCLLDLAVPRNVNPSVQRMEQVYLFNVDDLQTVVDLNMSGREAKVAQSRGIVLEEAAQFLKQWNARDVDRIVQELTAAVAAMADEETGKTLSKLPHLGEREREEIRYLARRLSGRLIHQPIQLLKEYHQDGHKIDIPDAIKKMFGVKNT